MIADDTITIRQATVEDAEPLLELVRQAMSVYARQSGIVQPLDALKETLADMVSHLQWDHVLVAVQNSQLVGTVRLVRRDARTAYFSRFAVLPHLRQTGVGRLLYQEAEQWLREQGYEQILLHTALSNQPLVAFYQARGFHLLRVSHDRGYARGTFGKDLKTGFSQQQCGVH